MGRIKELRMKRGLTQERVASEIGVTQQIISRVEANEETVPLDLLIRIAQFFNVSTDYILGLTDNKYENVEGNRLKYYWDKYEAVLLKYDALTSQNQRVIDNIMKTLTECEYESIESDKK